MIIDVNYKVGNINDYGVVIYAENGETLQISQSTVGDDNKIEEIYAQTPNSESSSILLSTY